MIYQVLMIGGAIDNMKTFQQFINEKYKPVQDETCGIDDNQVFRTGDIITLKKIMILKM